MNQLEGILLLIGIPLGLLLAGYWLATAFARSDIPTRLSIAMLTGLASLLLTVSLVNFFFPLSGVAAWVCLLPVFVSLTWKRSRIQFAQDLRAFFGRRSSWGYTAVVVLFFLLLLWPALSSFTTVMYDGTSNHDSFFWVVVAEHLKRHTYMEPPLHNPLEPLANAAEAVVGWKPAWGRMGSEGLIALCSAVVGLSPLKLYIYATACLFLPWLAVVHLSIRTFYAERLSRLAQVTVLGLHPVFIFFYSNSNLPNLLGVITGSTAVLATVSALRLGWDRRAEVMAWSVLLALALHGLYCAYSEMIPFVFLPCGLLWMRTFIAAKTKTSWRPRLTVACAVVASIFLNLASSWRAGWGFYAAYISARADNRWGNIMDQLHPAQYLPALGTLAAPAVKWLGASVGAVLTVLIAGGVVLVWRRARDPFGALLACSGGGALLLYTLAAHFVYGWQKSVQFTGIFVTAVVSGAVIDAYWQHRRGEKISRGGRTGAVALVVFLVFAVGMECREIYKWSERKLLSQDWFVLREQSYTALQSRPVLVEAATFRMAFFHSMWASYFLPGSHIYFGVRGEQSGGYLRNEVVNEATQKIPVPAAILVSRTWADSFDANSARILTGNEYVLLKESNRVLAMSGVFPLNGPPDSASSSIDLELQPHSAAQLLIRMVPLKSDDWPTATWRITRRVPATEEYSAQLTGAPPWLIKVPLIPRQKNLLKISVASDKTAAEPLPFVIRELRIESTP